jgi:hypothetical protein
VLCGPCNRRKGGNLASGLPKSNVPPPTRPSSPAQPWWTQPGLNQ